MTTITERLQNLSQYKFNPALMQKESLRILKQVTDGRIDIVDPTNPFVYALETTAVNTAMFIQHTEALNRRQYPSASVTYDDLYLHMSDKEYIGRFALPSSVDFNIVIPKDELINALILDPITGIKKITIPRNTEFKVADTIFSLQYPIDIKLMPHGGIQIVYDTSIFSDLYILENNLLEHNESTTEDGTTYIGFKFKTHQFNIITRLNDVNTSAGFISKIAYTDEYYHCKVYLYNSNSKWVEIKTTHTDQLYDIKTITALIKVKEKSIEVSIPSIYTNTGMVNGKIRIDLYQTKGTVDIAMSNYKLEDFSANWLSIDDNEKTLYTSAIGDIKTTIFFSTDITKGGRKEISIDELRKRVINNSIGSTNTPITSIQLQNSIQDAGYKFVKNIDTLTNRVYLATKPMPEPLDTSLVTSAASSMSTLVTSKARAQLAHGVIINDKRITITTDALLLRENGITKLVTEQKYQEINNYSNSNKVNHLNQNNYLFSPFYYVLDIDSNIFKSRPYHLNKPTIKNKTFISDNSLTGLQVNINNNYLIEKTDTGYKITVKTKSNELFKNLDDTNVFCQLAFKAGNQNQYSYLLGEQQSRLETSEERIFIFNLESNFDINEHHQISQNSFRFSDTSLSSYSDLSQEMHILFITNSSSLNQQYLSEADSLLGSFQLPPSCTVINHEKFTVNFGIYLEKLWNRAKSVLSNIKYERYTSDVYATYTEDVYNIDPITGSAFTVDSNNQLVYNILHHKDDPIIDPVTFLPIIKYRSGDIKLDNLNNPIPVGNIDNETTRYVDIMTIEAGYRFATDPSSSMYLDSLINKLLDWITNDIPSFNTRLLDQTKIYYYPECTIGEVKCSVGNNNNLMLSTTQPFIVDLSVPKETFISDELRNKINQLTIKTINNKLNSKTIAISDIEYELKNIYGKDVIDVSIKGFNNEHNVITILDDTSKLSIKKKLVLLPSNLVILQEDVTINFINHTK